MNPGDVLFVPFGWLAIPVALTVDQKEQFTKRGKCAPRRPEEYCSYLVHLVFDRELDSKHPPETKSFVLSNFVAGCNWLASSVRVLEAVQLWRRELETGGQEPSAEEKKE